MVKKLPPTKPDRSKININCQDEVRFWAKHLRVTKDQLHRAVEKVGDAAATVRKELANEGVLEPAAESPR